MGDVLVEKDKVFGDGVNVAARLQQLAKPSGVLISGIAFDNLQGKLDIAVDFAGEQHVKNIARAIRTYRVRLDADASSPWRVRLVQALRWRKLGVATVVLSALLVLGLAAAVGLQFWSSEPRNVRSLIAVLPFTNIGGEESTGRLADGITEDIITDLARFPEFEVVVRHSVEAYKGKALDIREVGRALNVGYVLKGSIQCQEGRVRITAQLLDAASGTHVWSERWDRLATDVFTVQTEIAELVTNRLGGGTGLVVGAERSLARRKRPENLTAYELYLLGGEKIEQLTFESAPSS